MMKLLFAVLVAMLGDEDFKTREMAEAWLRAMRPDSEPALIDALDHSPNSEVVVRAGRALIGPPPHLDHLIFVGFRYQSWNYYVEITKIEGDAVWVKDPDYPDATFYPAGKWWTIKALRECPQRPGTFSQRPPHRGK